VQVMMRRESKDHRALLCFGAPLVLTLSTGMTWRELREAVDVALQPYLTRDDDEVAKPKTERGEDAVEHLSDSGESSMATPRSPRHMKGGGPKYTLHIVEQNKHWLCGQCSEEGCEVRVERTACTVLYTVCPMPSVTHHRDVRCPIVTTPSR
jgi:hypothetical protein